MKNRVRQFWDHACKVYRLDAFLKRYKDFRCNPRISSDTIIALLILGIASRIKSFYQLERMGMNGELAKAIRGEKPSADTIAYSMVNGNAEELKDCNARIINKARYNKVFQKGTIRRWTVCGIDGTETYSTKTPCEGALGWSIRRYPGRKDEYYEKAVALSYVGDGPHLLLGMERVRPGEGEFTAAIRLLKEAAKRNNSYSDIICADALYAAAPFINEVLEQHKHVVIKVKQEDRILVKDMDGLVANRESGVILHGVTPKGEKGKDGHGVNYNLKIWDEENFTSWDGVKSPLRCLKVEETRVTTCRGEITGETVTECHIVTTVPKAIMEADIVWQIMHRRWDIENNTFCDLKQNWGFRHCYIHDPKAIEVWYTIFCVAVNLMMLFLFRNLKWESRKGTTTIEISRQILVSLITLSDPLPIPMSRTG
ncbi:MAG: transposase [Firmicutes bacterium]|nr:transposase [Bacillota bacterium]